MFINSTLKITEEVAECLYLLMFFNQNDLTCPGWCGSVDWVLACEPKCCWFDSQSGHMPGLWARSPVGHVRSNYTLMFLSLFPSPLPSFFPSFLSFLSLLPSFPPSFFMLESQGLFWFYSWNYFNIIPLSGITDKKSHPLLIQYAH